jgi:hypothetical protein
MITYALTMLIHVLAGTAPDFTAHGEVRKGLWALLADARWGFDEFEEAAFVVRDERGRHSLVRWPRPTVKHQAHWSGPYPPRTVAIVHTHPNWSPEPSEVDARAARRGGIPVYVLTRTKIMRTTGGTAETVFSGDWRPIG